MIVQALSTRTRFGKHEQALVCDRGTAGGAESVRSRIEAGERLHYLVELSSFPFLQILDESLILKGLDTGQPADAGLVDLPDGSIPVGAHAPLQPPQRTLETLPDLGELLSAQMCRYWSGHCRFSDMR
jgi:hypothetical protein